MTKKASAKGFTPIDLGFDSTPINLGLGKGFVIDLGMPKLEPCIPESDNKKDNNDMSLIGGLGGFAEDISKTVHDTKQDYDTFIKSTKLMKQDLTPGFQKLKMVIKKLVFKIKKSR